MATVSILRTLEWPAFLAPGLFLVGAILAMFRLRPAWVRCVPSLARGVVTLVAAAQFLDGTTYLTVDSPLGVAQLFLLIAREPAASIAGYAAAGVLFDLTLLARPPTTGTTQPSSPKA